MPSFVALLRREFWEHTSLLKIPAGMLLLIILGNIAFILWGADVGIYVSIDNKLLHGPDLAQASRELGPNVMATEISDSVRRAMQAMSSVISSVMQVVVIFYVLDSLFRERRDNSILFWKSLPVSDTKTVLSKLVIASIGIPVIGFIAIVTGQLLSFVIQGVMLRETPDALMLLWQNTGLPGLWAGYFYRGFLQSLWFFPLVGWMLYCSAVARKSPFALAILLPLLIIFIDSAFRLHTGISDLLLERVSVSVPAVAGFSSGMAMPGTSAIEFLTSIKVQGGLLVGIFFTVAAILSRRRQGEGLGS